MRRLRLQPTRGTPTQGVGAHSQGDCQQSEAGAFGRPIAGSTEHLCIPRSKYSCIAEPTAVSVVTSPAATPAQAVGNHCYPDQHAGRHSDNANWQVDGCRTIHHIGWTSCTAMLRLHVAPFAEQPEQQRNTATATRRAPTGTAMPNMASRQQRIAGSRWRFTEAATSSAVEATLCSPATTQATQHQDIGGPFQPCELAVSHAITSLPYAYSTQVCCTGTGAQPCNALRGPYSGRVGGLTLPGTPTLFQEPETSGSNQPPHCGRAVDRSVFFT
ncbi:hypothetical protein MRX96_055225 [Rhipicephalus microplus]